MRQRDGRVVKPEAPAAGRGGGGGRRRRHTRGDGCIERVPFRADSHEQAVSTAGWSKQDLDGRDKTGSSGTLFGWKSEAARNEREISNAGR